MGDVHVLDLLQPREDVCRLHATLVPDTPLGLDFPGLGLALGRDPLIPVVQPAPETHSILGQLNAGECAKQCLMGAQTPFQTFSSVQTACGNFFPPSIH